MKRIAFVVLMLGAAPVFAEAVRLTAFEEFEKQKSQILEDLNSFTVYKEISGGDMKVVKDTLARMSESLNGVADLSEMREEERAQLFNDQQLVNTILTMAENDSRQVCRRSGRLGTNFKTTTCETVKQRRQRQEADRRAIDSLIRGRPIDSN
ncbi:MAG: hypothetical protein R3348_04440 [Xanthomonadales bacterium]|nr:hypothetical protein [Xanthomonadales bacterium]